MRGTLSILLLLAAAEIRCTTSPTSPVPVSNEIMERPRAHERPPGIECAPDALGRIADALPTVSGNQQGYAFAHGVLELCERPLPSDARDVMRGLVEGTPFGPEQCSELPENAEDFVALSSVGEPRRSGLCLAYALMTADCRHFQGQGFRMPPAHSGTPSKEGDVEVGVTPSGLRVEGHVLAANQTLASVLRPARPDTRLVLVADRNDPWSLVSASWDEARQAGFAELGLLGQLPDGRYRVVGFRVASRIDHFGTVVGMDLDGFHLGSPDPDSPICSLRDSKPDVDLLKPGSDLSHHERWNFDGLQRALERSDGHRSKAALVVADAVHVRDVLRLVEHVRISLCGAELGAECDAAFSLVEACGAS